jgi:hypothetical protein
MYGQKLLYSDVNLTLGDGVLIAAHDSVTEPKFRYYLEFTNEYLWSETPIEDGFNLLITNLSLCYKPEGRGIASR